MAAVDSFRSPSTNGLKRSRTEGSDDLVTIEEEHQRKHPRPTLSHPGFGPPDDILDASTSVVEQYRYTKYESDGQSSLISEPGSPQDLSMSSSDQDRDDDDDDDDDDDMMDEFYAYSPPEDTSLAGSGNNLWRDPLSRKNRTSTPFAVKLPRPTSSRPRSNVQQHIRQRHPQENSSEYRDAPSPIDEDEVSTPQSAAATEAAGSQLSMLSMSDMEMSSSEPLHSLAVASLPDLTTTQSQVDACAFETDPLRGPLGLLVRKGRQRSGAQSSGSASPGRIAASSPSNDGRRGFSVGYRPDCEKCRMHVPGHMNHFVP